MSIHLKKFCNMSGNLSVLAFGILLLKAMFVSHSYTVCVYMNLFGSFPYCLQLW